MSNSPAAIIGWAHTPFGKLDMFPDVETLMTAVVGDALAHASVAAQDIGFAAVGSYNNGFQPQQGFEAGLLSLAESALRHTPAIRVENACATGSAAIHAALDFIGSGAGQPRIALVVGVEKMTAIPSKEVGNILLSASYRKEENSDQGFAGVFARVADAYFARYGDHSDDLARIAAKNHANGCHNPLAHVRKALDFDFCNTVSEKNPLVAGKLRRTDCSLVSDGAAALVLADAQTAASMQRAVHFRARQQANDFLPLSRRDPIAFDGARLAWDKAKTAAGIQVQNLSFVETHDCFTIAEMIEYEAMGLAQPGEGWRVIRDGISCKDGSLPVNPSGGLKAKGHPIGATGVSMHVMAAMQLCGEAGDMQLPNPTLAGVFNMGGLAVANYVSILERVR